MEHGYHLVSFPQDPIGGVAMLVHVNLEGPKKPKLSVHMPGRMISFENPLHGDPNFLPAQVFGLYGSSSASIRKPNFRSKLAQFMGDWNVSTRNSDATT